MIVKTQGSASEQSQNPVFFHVFVPLDCLPYKLDKTDTKVLVFNDESTNRSEHTVKENVKTQGSA